MAEEIARLGLTNTVRTFISGFRTLVKAGKSEHMTEINGFKINSKRDPKYSNAKEKKFEIWGRHQLRLRKSSSINYYLKFFFIISR